MSLNLISIAAATAVVGFDMLRNRPDISVAATPRIIRSIGLTGSAAVGDATIEVKVGARTVATLVNNLLNFPAADSGQFSTMYAVPAGSPISVIVTDAPATNPLNLLIDV